jgi:hypothetical protein
MGVEPQVDDVADAESVDIGQLRLGRLAGCRYPIIETTPVVDRFKVGYGTPLLRSSSRRPHWKPAFGLAGKCPGRGFLRRRHQ